MGLAQRDLEHHTYGDYLKWSEDVHYELIDGVAYLMAPAPTLDHQDVAGEIFRQLANALQQGPCRVFIAPVDVRIPKADEADERIDQELAGETPVGALPGVAIAWDELAGRLPEPER